MRRRLAATREKIQRRPPVPQAQIDAATGKGYITIKQRLAAI